jgi:hypothetical protein
MIPDFGYDLVAVARKVLERGSKEGMSAVKIGQVESPHTPLIGSMDKSMKIPPSHTRSVRLPIVSTHTRAEREPGNPQFRLAELNHLVGIEAPRCAHRAFSKVRAQQQAT